MDAGVMPALVQAIRSQQQSESTVHYALAALRVICFAAPSLLNAEGEVVTAPDEVWA